MPVRITVPGSGGAPYGPAAGSADRAISEMQFRQGQQLSQIAASGVQQGFSQLFATARQERGLQARQQEAATGRQYRTSEREAGQKYRTAERKAGDVSDQDRDDMEKFGVAGDDMDKIAKIAGVSKGELRLKLTEALQLKKSQEVERQRKRLADIQTKAMAERANHEANLRNQQFVLKNSGTHKMAFSPSDLRELERINAEMGDVRNNADLTAEEKIQAIEVLQGERDQFEQSVVSLTQEERQQQQQQAQTLQTLKDAGKLVIDPFGNNQYVIDIDKNGNPSVKVSGLDGGWSPLSGKERIARMDTLTAEKPPTAEELANNPKAPTRPGMSNVDAAQQILKEDKLSFDGWLAMNKYGQEMKLLDKQEQADRKAMQQEQQQSGGVLTRDNPRLKQYMAQALQAVVGQGFVQETNAIEQAKKLREVDAKMRELAAADGWIRIE